MAHKFRPGYDFRSADFRSQPDRRDRGGSGNIPGAAETGNPCACGQRCAERDYQGQPKRGPRAFCETDRDYIGTVIRRLPETYVLLRGLLVPAMEQDERVSGSREAPVPMNLDVQAFMQQVVHVALSWEDQVRAFASLSDPDECPACKGDGETGQGACAACLGAGKVKTRDGAALARACRLLGGTGHRDSSGCMDTGYLDKLLLLPPEPKERFIQPDRKVSDLPPGTFVRIDSSGDAWGEAEDMDGTAAGLEFLRLDGRARGILGFTRQRRRITEVPCDGCRGKTLVQQEAKLGGWEPVVRCTACPVSYTGAAYDLLMGRVYQEQLKALRQAS
jgi:hypothetical protein